MNTIENQDQLTNDLAQMKCLMMEQVVGKTHMEEVQVVFRINKTVPLINAMMGQVVGWITMEEVQVDCQIKQHVNLDSVRKKCNFHFSS